jgi:hypothetical protein
LRSRWLLRLPCKPKSTAGRLLPLSRFHARQKRSLTTDPIAAAVRGSCREASRSHGDGGIRCRHRAFVQCRTAPRRRSAWSRHSISILSSNGLFRNPTAPALRTCASIPRSGDAVTKIIGTELPREINWLCSSIPLNPGIWRSVIKQVVPSICSDWRKSSADGNVTASKPSERTRPNIASRTEGSSSTMEITAPHSWLV